jgi:transcriptional regulator with XRE-family HTH domain
MDARRRDLRLTWDEVATRAGINRETLRQIRIGNGDIRPLSATGIEDALGWDRGSIEAILAGDKPTTFYADAERATLERDYQDPAVAELALELKQLKAEQARHREETNELRNLLKQITGKDPGGAAHSGGEEPERDEPRQAM